MSAPMSAQPPPPPGYQPSYYQRPPRRSVAAMIIGWILIVLGFLTALSGAVLLALFGSGSAITSNVNTFSANTPALVSDLGLIEGAPTSSAWRGLAGEPTLQINAASPAEPIFVGIGPTADVDTYLSGVARTEVNEFNIEPFNLVVIRRDGANQASPPADQSFWVATLESESSSQLSWPFADGRYSVVVMNADGSAGVDAPLSVGISFRNSMGLWITVLVIGAVLLLGGILLVVFGSRRRPPEQAWAPSPYQGGGPMPAGPPPPPPSSTT
jgi:uncharacterized membrane protein